jgi:hypothetical protein
VVAALGAGSVRCVPPPQREAATFRWTRIDRWSAAYAGADCSVTFDAPTDVAAVRLRAHLPRAREAVVFRVSARGAQGDCGESIGALALEGDETGAIVVRCPAARSLDVRLVPAFLPYLNLLELEVLG